LFKISNNVLYFLAKCNLLKPNKWKLHWKCSLFKISKQSSCLFRSIKLKTCEVKKINKRYFQFFLVFWEVLHINIIWLVRICIKIWYFVKKKTEMVSKCCNITKKKIGIFSNAFFRNFFRSELFSKSPWNWNNWRILYYRHEKGKILIEISKTNVLNLLIFFRLFGNLPRSSSFILHLIVCIFLLYRLSNCFLYFCKYFLCN
jgi:hypothetical protein